MALGRRAEDPVEPDPAPVESDETEAEPETDPAADVPAEPAKDGGLRVVAPLVSVRFGDKVLQYSYGDILPPGVSETSVELLKSLGFLEQL